MQAKFLRVAHAQECNMIKAVVEDKEVWVDVSSKVKEFAKTNFQEGDMIEGDLVKAKKSWKCDGYFKKVGGTESKPEVKKEPEAAKSSYTPPASSTTSSGSTYKSYGKTPEERQDIRRQAVGHMTANFLGRVEGVTVENYQEYAEQVYNTFLALVQGE